MLEPFDICVMLGGPSGEREVSLQSGAAVADALRSLGHRVSEIDPVDGEFRLPLKPAWSFSRCTGRTGKTALFRPSSTRWVCPTPAAVRR